MPPMELYITDRPAWRAWLAKHHESVDGIWLVFYKKHTGKPSLAYDDAVEEALCFGWIDSIVKRLDDDRYVRKFTPRRNTTNWSEANLRRIAKLKRSGLMTPIGLAKIPNGVVAPPAPRNRPSEAPPVLAEALKKNPAAAQFFATLAPSYRRNYIHWISSAKREETRRRRVDEVVERLAQGKKPGMK